MQVIAVDNDCKRLDNFVNILEGAYTGVMVTGFCDPFRAVQHISALQADIVFVDSELKPFEAFEFARLVKGYWNETRVYIVSDEEDGCAKGSDYITGNLTRPVTHEKLLDTAMNTQ